MIELFNFNQHQVRVSIDQNGDPWWVATDVCAVLGIANGRQAVGRIDSDDVCSTDAIDSLGRTQRSSTVNEAGLYSLILASRKPEAKAFKRWLTHEVLPTLRRTGSYSVEPQLPPIPEPREMLTGWLATLDRAEQAEARIEQLEGPASAWEALAAKGGAYTLRKAAQVLWTVETDTGQNRLMKTLKEWRWVSPNGQPYQTHVTRGLLRLRADSDQILITTEGLDAIRQRMADENQTKLELVAS